MKTFVGCLAATAVAAFLAGCAEVPTDPEDRAEFEAINDPLEPTNRAIFDFNMALDRNIAKPVAKTYHEQVPEVAQKGIHNALNNLRAPMTFINDVLQGEPDRAAQTMVRFMFNSTAGLGGLYDIVTDTNGPRYHSEDLGQTMAVWGVGDGPYLMLPFFGPSNPRDAVGTGAEYVADPVGYVDIATWATASKTGVGVVDERTQYLDPLDELERGSLDFYAALRSVYRQRRANDIANKDLPLSESFKAGGSKK
ncbi:MAG: VacJ family lipoprotein [Actinomycetota bacterium]